MKMIMLRRDGIFGVILGLCMIGALASPAEAGWDWQACKTIPRYPNARNVMYWMDPPSGKLEDVIVQHTNDSKEAIGAWAAKALPGWKYFETDRDRYPQRWGFHDPNSRREVNIQDGYPSRTINFECTT